jgi:hypothetical protein
VKRLLVLLIVVAGGLAAASFAVPSNAATVNGVAISQSQINSDVTAIAASPAYQCFLDAEEFVGTEGQEAALPAVAGTGLGSDGTLTTATTAFTSAYLDTVIGHQLVESMAAQRGITLSKAQLAAGHTGLSDQITSTFSQAANLQQQTEAEVCGSSSGSFPTAAQVIKSMPTSFVSSAARFGATVSVLEEDLSGVGSTSADLERYYDARKSTYDSVCITVAPYQTLADAQAGAAKVASGTPFATVATAAQGGQDGCPLLAEVTASVPSSADLSTLPLNTVSTPIDENGTYLLLEFTSRNATPFAQAKSVVQDEIEAKGATKANDAVEKSEKVASVSVDPRYGKWVPSEAHVVTPVAPLPADVLNVDANSGETVPTAGASSSSSSSSSSLSG